MKIQFLGTRGFIKERTRRHYRHTTTMLLYRKKKIMIDCGIDWRKKVFALKPDAIVITHAHPDHAWGLTDGTPCPVYATKESWHVMRTFKIEKHDKRIVFPYKPVTICGITFETFPVAHSLRAPGVGYRISVGKKTIFCVHDVVYIEKRKEALNNILLYIGDGATITRPLVRKRDNILFGHTPISTQLTWCRKEKIPQAIFTHCGSQIVAHDARSVEAKIRALAKERHVRVKVAYDGMSIDV